MLTATVSTPDPESVSASANALRTILIADLRAHPAQMRTVYDIAPMAELTLQVFANRGVDAWNPIVAAPAPDGHGYVVVSGHRRRMATLFSWALELWLARSDTPDTHLETLSIEEVSNFISALISKYEDVESAADALATKFADREVEVVIFNGDIKAQILALQRANYGAEAPDPLGIAYSFRAALDEGATEAAIARNVGQPVSYVHKHLALTRVPVELAELIGTGKLPMSVAGIVADVQPETARNGVALFVVTNAQQVTADGLKACAAALKSWHQFATMPMTVAHQGQRNMIRILATLWAERVTAKPLQSWATAVMLIYRGVNHTTPWEDRLAYSEWVRYLGGDTYYREPGGILWDTLVQEFLQEIECEQCPLSRLPERILQQDLSDRPGILGRPCRTLQRAEAQRCINGFAAGDALEVRVPFAWAEHPGVTKQGQFYFVTESDALQQAWQAQAAGEDAEIAQAEAATATVPAPESNPVSDNSANPQSGAASPMSPAGATAAPGTTPQPDATDSPVVKMRAQIRAFMETHANQAVRHPFATPCAGCQHQLEQSPTKDPKVPHCAWAGRLRTVQFLTLASQDGQLAVPVCRQYAPNRPWQELIPAHPAPVPLPRDYLLSQVRLHAREGDRHSDRHPFEFLTGRPMGSDSYKGWFETQLSEQVGTLSDAQLFTLFVWSLAEYERARHAQQFLLPADSQASTFIPVSEITTR